MKIRPMLCAMTLLICCAGLDPLRVRADEVIHLEQALRIALEKSPVLDATRSAVDAAEARLTQVKSAYYPQVDASAGYYHAWADSAGGATAGNTRESFNNYSAGLSVSQYLFDFGKTPAEVETSRQSLAASGRTYETSEKTLVRDVKQAYFEILKNQQLVLVGQEQVSLKKQQLTQARALYDQGMRPKVDVTRAEVEISRAQLQLLNDQFGLRRSIITFERLLGGPPVQGTYSLAEEKSEAPPPAALAPLIDLAVQARPEIMRIEAQILSAEAQIVSARRSAFPNLAARGSYGKSDDIFPPENDRWQVGLNVDWPLFTGFRTTGRVAEARADVNGLKAQLNSLMLSITEEVTRSFLLVQQTGEAIKTSEVALRQARENLSMAEGRYRNGVSNSLELSDAQVLYTESRSALVQSVYEQQKALAELEFSVGGRL